MLGGGIETSLSVILERVPDTASQLTGITYKKGATTLGDLAYTYDTVGRRTTVGGSFARTSLPTALTANAVYDNNNRLTSWAGATITYDANGNMTSDGTKTYVWDARDRLVQIKTGATVNASFAYDALGRRSTRTVSGATTKFLYDGLNPIQEQSASNAATANLLTGLGVDGFISRTTVSDGLTVHFLPDALNSTLALTDSSGVVSTSYTYEPFGKATKTGAATTNTYGFTGREDDGTGLMYYRARYYNPSTQRFISEDPIGLSGGINAYAYVDGDPIDFNDPLGLLSWCDGLNALEGFADVVSFGLTGSFNDMTGASNFYDSESDAYTFGMAAGYAWGAAYSGAASAASIAQGPLVYATRPRFPFNPVMLNRILRVLGKPVPDAPNTPGRGKIVWSLPNGKSVTYEQHPYHPDAPAWHRDPHYHVDTPGIPHARYLPGNKLPWRILK